MTIRMSGMVSGMDTESLVSAMVSTYVSKKEKYQKMPRPSCPTSRMPGRL